MQVLKVLSAAAITALFVASATAEEYEGVLQVRSAASRSDVRAEAVAAARLPNPYAEGADSGIPDPVLSAVDRGTVRTQARATARAGNLYGDAWSPGVLPRGSSLAGIEGVQQDM